MVLVPVETPDMEALGCLCGSEFRGMNLKLSSYLQQQNLGRGRAGGWSGACTTLAMDG